MGGISDARDALEFMIAGATAVQVGTANFVDPLIWPKLLDGIRGYMERHQIARISDLVGTVQTTSAGLAWMNFWWRSTWTRSIRRVRAGGRTARRRRRIQNRQPAVHEPRAVIRRGAASPRRSRLPRPEVSRHPEHGGRRGGRRHPSRRVDGQRARLGRPDDDAGRARGGRHRSRAPVPPGAARHRRDRAHEPVGDHAGRNRHVGTDDGSGRATWPR